MAGTGEPHAQLVQHDGAVERRGLLARLIRAQEDERRQIATDIHDVPAQKMSAVGMRLVAIRRKIDDPQLLRELDELDATVRRSIDELRHLTFELRLPDLDREGLASALRDYVSKCFEREGVQVEVHLQLATEPCAEIAAVAYRIAQEALREARARANANRIEISIRDAEQDGFLIRIHDDEPTAEATEGPPVRPDVATLHERAALAGGYVRTRGGASGTTVDVWLPSELDSDPRLEAEPMQIGGDVRVRS